MKQITNALDMIEQQIIFAAPFDKDGRNSDGFIIVFDSGNYVTFELDSEQSLSTNIPAYPPHVLSADSLYAARIIKKSEHKKLAATERDATITSLNNRRINAMQIVAMVDEKLKMLNGEKP